MTHLVWICSKTSQSTNIHLFLKVSPHTHAKVVTAHRTTIRCTLVLKLPDYNRKQQVLVQCRWCCLWIIASHLWSFPRIGVGTTSVSYLQDGVTSTPLSYSNKVNLYANNMLLCRHILKHLRTIIIIKHSKMTPGSASCSLIQLDKKFASNYHPLHLKGIMCRALTPQHTHIATTDQRPVILVWSNTTQEVWVIELTVCFKTWCEEAHIWNTYWYTDLMEQITEATLDGTLVLLEVGSRWYLSFPASTR